MTWARGHLAECVGRLRLEKSGITRADLIATVAFGDVQSLVSDRGQRILRELAPAVASVMPAPR